MEQIRKYRFKEGDAVAHVNNLGKKLYVRRIIKKIKKETYGKDGEGKDIIITSEIMLGIECHWWEGQGENSSLVKDKFHSIELIPWDVAQQELEKNNKDR